MNQSELKTLIDKIIDNTFKVIKEVYVHQNENKPNKKSSNVGSRILFPKYSSGDTRISEQELRFIFIEQFYAYINGHKELNNLYYSVETPTEENYIFSKDKGDPKVVDKKDKNGNKGVSARTDLTIYEKEGDKFTKKALIEFKARNPVIENYEKDFCKLNNEENTSIKYFIQIIKNYDKETLKSIKDKIKNKNDNINYKCYCLDKGEDITRKITDIMRIKIHRGIDQIGGCITEIQSASGTKILIDLGHNLPEADGQVNDIYIRRRTSTGFSKEFRQSSTHTTTETISLSKLLLPRRALTNISVGSLKQ